MDWLIRAIGGLVMLGSVGSAWAQTATVTGDMYLVTRGGEIRQGAGNTVDLVPQDGTLAEGWQEVCEPQSAEFVEELQEHVETLQRLTREREAADAAGNAELVRELIDRFRNTQATYETLVALKQRANALERVEWIRSQAAASASTGMNANYRLEVSAGRYWLFTTMSLGDNDYWWIVPLELATGEERVLDLDGNNSLNQDEFLCGNNPFLLEESALD